MSPVALQAEAVPSKPITEPPVSAVRSAPQRGAEIPASIAKPVVSALRERGVLVLDAATNRDDELVAGSTLDTMLEAAAGQLGDHALGVHLASCMPVGAFGVVDYAFCSSADLREALQRLSRHFHLVNGYGELRTAELGDRASVFVSGRSPSAGDRHRVELALAAIVERIRHVLGRNATVIEVRFSHPAPPQTEAHEDFFGAPVLFSQAEDSIVFASELLGRALRTAAPDLALLIDAKLTELHRAPELSDQLVDRARRAIATLLDAREQGVEKVADLLGLSSRTLQRELQRRGTSHSALVDEVRCARTIELLDARLTATEIADRLGFSEPGAFFRAFRRWTGTSPKAFRRARERSLSSENPALGRQLTEGTVGER